MKKRAICATSLHKMHLFVLTLTLAVGVSLTCFSQSKTASTYLDSAVTYQRKFKNFSKALTFYELAIKSGNHGNYTYYNAAQCACQVGETEKAIDYYKKGFAILLDYSNYEFFSTDTLINCFNQTQDWRNYLTLMKTKNDSSNLVLTNYIAFINDTTKRINSSLLSDSIALKKVFQKRNYNQASDWIKNYNSFAIISTKNQDAMYQMKVNDTLTVPFFVHVSSSYNPLKKTKLYVFLHGGVGQRPRFSRAPMLYDGDKQILAKSIEEGAIVLYPLARKGFNWLFNQEAFNTILQEISFVKSLYNVDDNKVFVGGHSDGGIGSFWLATHKPNAFAAFLGLNFNARSYFDNTNLINLKNKSIFYGISAKDDRTFSTASVNNIKNYAVSLGLNWRNFTLEGEHGLPYDNPSATYFIYDSLFNQKRNLFPATVQWQTDNTQNGRCRWLEITQLDTLRRNDNWHEQYNPPPMTLNGKDIVYNFNPHKFALIKAAIKNNVFTIQQSCVKELAVYIYPEQIDLKKPVKIYVDGKEVYNAFVVPNKEDMLNEFIKTKDRTAIVAKKIVITL